jgi:hypothetical protein
MALHARDRGVSAGQREDRGMIERGRSPGAGGVAQRAISREA